KRYIPVSQLNRRYGDIIKSNDIVYIVNAFPLIPVAKRFGKKVIVHLHDYRPISPSAAVLAGTSNLSNFGLLKEGFYTLLIQRRGVESLIKNVLNVPYTLQIRRWVCMADTILAVSKRHAELLTNYMPECNNKMRVLYNPPPKLPAFKKNLEAMPTFLYCGGDNYLKGFHVLIKVLKILGEKRQTNFKLIFTNKYRQKSLSILNKLRRHYNLNIEVYGMVNYNDLIKLHSRTWALLFPSIWEEPLPYTIMEALLMGTLPVAFSVGGVPELVEKTCAEEFLIPPNKYKRLLEAIETITNYDKHYFENHFTHKLINAHSISIKFNEQKLLEDFLDVLF
ncbi:MAG: glycosyltransferase family 4 protein, partial [Desulfurococcaceae archaeon]